jgi:hypothetical protein
VRTRMAPFARLCVVLGLVVASLAADANFGCSIPGSTANWESIPASKFASNEPSGAIPRDKLKVGMWPRTQCCMARGCVS